MSFYKWDDDKLQLNENGKISEIIFPEKADGVPVFNRGRRYVAVGAGNKIYVYDFEAGSFTMFSHRFKTMRYDIRFGPNDNLYYVDGNHIRVIDIKNVTDTLLYNAGRKQHHPQNIGISPGGRYVSFRRYRSDSYFLYVFDTEREELRDYKISLYHYAWLDDDHIVFSLGGGLKMSDVTTGKSQLVIRDHGSLIKRSKNKYTELFGQFKGIDRSALCIGLDLIRVLNGNIYFSLAINYFGQGEPGDEKKHYGIWSVNLEKNTTEFHYEFSGDYRKAGGGYKFLLDDGSLAWATGEWRIFDGASERTLPGDWNQAICFDSLNV